VCIGNNDTTGREQLLTEAYVSPEIRVGRGAGQPECEREKKQAPYEFDWRHRVVCAPPNAVPRVGTQTGTQMGTQTGLPRRSAEGAEAGRRRPSRHIRCPAQAEVGVIRRFH
jgi:hypothetical protein